jgi:hypothetical protein
VTRNRRNNKKGKDSASLKNRDWCALRNDGVLRGCWFGSLARGLGLPGFAKLFAMLEHEGFGFVEAGVDLGAFDGVAGSAAGDQVARILLSLPGAGVDEIDAHHQRVLETGAAVQATVFAAVIIAFQNLQTLLHGDR